jgi:hypothetical protein
MIVALTMVSGNRKVGPIPVSTTEKRSCPSECGVNGTDCYALFGPLGMHWRKVGEGNRGWQWTLFCRAVAKFMVNQLWRHNQAGDLPQTEDGKIDADKCRELSEASRHTRGWTYTHYTPLDPHNAAVIRDMNSVPGMAVNLSADTMRQADQYYALGIAPVVVMLPEDAPVMGNKTPGGLPIVVCPAQTAEDMSCHQCKLCQVRDRKSIVGFLAHGTAGKRLSRKLREQP